MWYKRYDIYENTHPKNHWKNCYATAAANTICMHMWDTSHWCQIITYMIKHLGGIYCDNKKEEYSDLFFKFQYCRETFTKRI